jgi:hypothetical protein
MMHDTRAQLTLTTLAARRQTLHAELLEAMRTVERYRGALALLDELLALSDAPGAEDPAPVLEAVA